MKNIVICSDGTGNRGGKTRGTNIWRIFNAVNRYHPDVKQITYYDDGVGTEDLLWLRLLGGSFGCGLSRNILQAYAYLAMNYEKGDRVFLFGFSRGAFTMRSLAGMICRCGLITRENLVRVGWRKRECILKRILCAYRSAKGVKDTHDKEDEAARIRRISNALKISDIDLRPVPIHFIGVWDTVDAVGVPFDELKLVDYFWRKVFKRRLWGFHDCLPHRLVSHAYQALSIDDERKTFHPNVWDCPDSNTGTNSDKENTRNSNASGKQVIEQVWFAGVHSNVGGGYPKDSLSLIPLDWMMGKADAHGLRFLDYRWKEFRDAADAHGRIYDSRAGLGVFYRYAPRDLYEQPAPPPPDNAKFREVIIYTLKKLFGRLKMVERPCSSLIHFSVFDRIKRGTNYYAPKVIREEKENMT